jgi:uncharacterized membrane protein
LNNKAINLLLVIVALLLTVTIAHSLTSPDFGSADVALRYLGALLGAVAMGVTFYFTREGEAWTVGMREITYGVAGAMLYTVFLWLFSGAMFAIPSVGDLGLRPAVVFPILFGYFFGPIPGFIAGGFGNVFGNLLGGLPLSPEWEVAAGLVGFVAGLHMLFPDKPRTLNIVSGLVGGIGLLGTLVYLLTPAMDNQFAGAPMTPWLGYSVLVGAALCLGLHYAFPEQIWSKVVLWGALGSLAGLGLASLSDIWVDAGKLGAAQASVGRFLPAAGPNLIAVVILVPFLVAAYGAMQEAEAA